MEKIAQCAYIVSDPAYKLEYVKAVKFNNEIKILCEQGYHGGGGFTQDCSDVIVLTVKVPESCTVEFYIIAGYNKDFDGAIHEAKSATFVKKEELPHCFSENNIAFTVVQLEHSNDAFHEHGIRV